MRPSRTKPSPWFFLAALLTFFLTFSTLSCQGRVIRTVTGVQAAVGTTVRTQPAFGPSQTRRIPPNPYVLLALAAAIGGLTVALTKKGHFAVALATSTGGIGIVGLLLFRQGSINVVAHQGEGMLSISFGPGYWLCMLSFIGAFAWHLAGMRLESDPAEVAAPVTQPNATAGVESVDAG